MATGPRDPASAGRDRLRASHADREQVIESLKTAFVVGRLTKDEFAARTGQALAARTYADLAALTADLPAEQVTAVPAHAERATAGPPPVEWATAPPVPAARRPMARAATVSGVCLAVALAAVVALGDVIAVGPSASPPAGWLLAGLFYLAAISVITAVSALGAGAIASIGQRRSRGQLPPPPRPGGRALPLSPTKP